MKIPAVQNLGLSGKLTFALARRLRTISIRGIPRLLYWAGRLALGRGPRLLPSITGFTISADPFELPQSYMLFGRYQVELFQLLPRLIREGDSVIDIGAELGFVTLHLSRLVGKNGHVTSFEPDPTAMARLQSTLSANCVDNVRVSPVAAADRDGELTLYAGGELGFSSAVNGAEPSLQPISVPCLRIDTIVSQHDFPRPVIFVKIDVEGFETAIIAGMDQLIEADRPYIIMEVNSGMLKLAKSSTSALLKSVAQHRYRIFRIARRDRGIRLGRVVLEPIDPSTPVYFCDALAVPEERQLPQDPALG